MSGIKDTNGKLSDHRDSVNMANTMQTWPRLSAEALHRIESAEGEASKVLADSIRPYTPGNPSWVRNRDTILEGGYRVIDFIAAYAEAVFNAHSAEYETPGSSGVLRSRIAPLVRKLVNWPWMAWIFSTSVVGQPFSEQPLPWKKRKLAPGQWEIPSPQALRLRYPNVKSVRISIADKPVDSQLAGGLAELQKRFSAQIERLLEERISHWENSARAAAVMSPENASSDRREMVDAYIDECLQVKGEKISRTMIWKAAGYKSRTEFERWERYFYETRNRKANAAADQLFRRLLLKEKPHLK